MISSIKKITQGKRKLYINFFVIVFLSIFILSIAVLTILANQEKKLKNKIYPNIYIDQKAVELKTKEEALKIIKEKNKNLNNLAINLLYEDTAIATISAKEINLHWNGREIADRAFTIGRDQNSTSKFKQRIETLFGLKRYDLYTKYIYEQDLAQELIATISSRYNKEPENALFKIENDRVAAFKEDKPGQLVDEELFIKNIDKIVEKINSGRYKIKPEKIKLKQSTVEAEIKLAQANDLGIEELIGVGKSDYSGSITSRIHNLTLAASKFHGVIIPKDSTFSFNEVIGDISVNTGYQQAYIIQNGKTVLGDGGGVCQVSTTIFRAALQTGLPIEERHAHAYRVGYYENDSQPGFDATIYSPTVDLKVKNDTPANILIQTEIIEEKNLLIFKLYGKNDNRQVEISQATVYDIVPAPPAKHEDDPTLPKGEVKQIDFAAPGAKTFFDYKVTKDGNTHYEERFFSSYKPWAAVYLVGTKE
jgi:vancomycin resistance protein YoaR